MAEFVFKDLVKKGNIESDFIIESAATSYEEVGNDMHRGTKKKLSEENIPYTKHCARKLVQADYEKYDYIIGMEESNVLNIIGICGEDKENKIYKLLEFTTNPKDIDDPWYSGDFNKTFDDVVEGCNGFLKFLYEKGKIWLQKNKKY